MNMEFNFVNIVSLINLCISLLFALYLFSTSGKKRLSNSLFAFYLVISGVDGASQYLFFTVYPFSATVGMLISQMVFLKIPLLYMYVLSVIYENFKLKPLHMIHSGTYFFIILMFIPGYYLLSEAEKIELLSRGDSVKMIIFKLSYIIIHLQVIIYFFLIFNKLNRYKKLLHENYSNAEWFDYKWLFQLNLILFFDFLFAAVKNLFLFLETSTIYEYSVSFVNFFAFVAVCWIVLKALKTPKIFTGINPDLETSSEIIAKQRDESPEMNKETLLTPEEKGKLDKLVHYIKTEELYSDPDLTIFDLAKQIDMPSKDLSVLINKKLKQHFFLFINNFRIEKAKELLHDPEQNNLTVLEILYDVGFNSKSSFNTAFKKNTGMTPTEYRKKI